MLTLFSAAVIAFCILAWDKATGISAEEKQEIGILKAIGWDTSDVLALKFWEGLIIAMKCKKPDRGGPTSLDRFAAK